MENNTRDVGYKKLIQIFICLGPTPTIANCQPSPLFPNRVVLLPRRLVVRLRSNIFPLLFPSAATPFRPWRSFRE
jgi:hypothetical protein